MSVPENRFVAWLGDATTFAKGLNKDAKFVRATAQKPTKDGNLNITAEFGVRNEDPEDSTIFTVSGANPSFSATNPVNWPAAGGGTAIEDTSRFLDPTKIFEKNNKDTAIKAYTSLKLAISNGVPLKPNDPVYTFSTSSGRIGPNVYSALTGIAIKV